MLAKLKNTTSAISVKTGAMLRSWSARNRLSLKPARRCAFGCRHVIVHAPLPLLTPPPAGRPFRYGRVENSLRHHALADHRHAVGQRQNGLGLGRQHQHGDAAVAQRLDDADHVFLGADIHAARRLRQDQHLGQMGQPLGQRHLLLVAARQRTQRDAGARRPDLQILDVRLGDLSLDLGLQAAGGECGQEWRWRRSCRPVRCRNSIMRRFSGTKAMPALARAAAVDRSRTGLPSRLDGATPKLAACRTGRGTSSIWPEPMKP